MEIFFTIFVFYPIVMYIITNLMIKNNKDKYKYLITNLVFLLISIFAALFFSYTLGSHTRPSNVFYFTFLFFYFINWILIFVFIKKNIEFKEFIKFLCIVLIIQVIVLNLENFIFPPQNVFKRASAPIKVD